MRTNCFMFAAFVAAISIISPAEAQTIKISEHLFAPPSIELDWVSPDAPAISEDGRYVAFQALYSNLVADDTNGRVDIFVRDTLTGVTERINLAPDQTQANNDSGGPSISADGRYVAYESAASNLVAGDTNGVSDIFLFDRLSRLTSRVSFSSSGQQALGACGGATISGNGAFIAFRSSANNLVAGDTNNRTDIFLRNLLSGETTRASLNVDGTQRAQPRLGALSLNYDGSILVYDETIQGEVYAYNALSRVTSRISLPFDGSGASTGSIDSSVSGDGKFVVFTGHGANLVSDDTNTYPDIFIAQLDSKKITRVSVDSNGLQHNKPSASPKISKTGRYVYFIRTNPLGLKEIVVKDLKTGVTNLVQTANSNVSQQQAYQASGDGKYVTYVRSKNIYRSNNDLYEVEICSPPLVPELSNEELIKKLELSCGSYLSLCRNKEFDCVKFTLFDLLERKELNATLYSQHLGECLLAGPTYEEGISVGFNQGLAAVDTDAIRLIGFNAGVASIDQAAIKEASFDAGVKSIDVERIKSVSFAQGAASIPVEQIKETSFAEGAASIDVAGIKLASFAEGASSVDVNSIKQISYDQGFSSGVASIDLEAIKALSYQQGVSSVNVDYYKNLGYQEGVASCPVVPVKKVLICHKEAKGSSTLSVNVNSLAAHYGHGDTLGGCPTNSPTKKNKK